MSEVLATVLLTGITLFAFGGFGYAVLASVQDADVVPHASFSLAADTGVAHVTATMLSGSSFLLGDVVVALTVNGTSSAQSHDLVGGTSASRIAAGDALRVNVTVDAPHIGPGTRLTLIVVHKETGRLVGMAYHTVPDPGSSPSFLAGVPSVSDAALSPSRVTADGLHTANVSVNVSHSFGRDLVRSVTLDLTDANGTTALELADDGQGADATAADGTYSLSFTVPARGFATNDGTHAATLTLTATDVMGKSASTTLTLTQAQAAQSKVTAGARWLDVAPSASVKHLNFTNFTVRDATALDNDQLQMRVSDLSDSTKAWAVLVSFAYSAPCAATAGVTSIQVTRDGQSGSATYTPSSGCFTLGASTVLNLTDPAGSLDASGAAQTWTVSGSVATHRYSSAGVGGTNEAVVTFFGDTLLPGPGNFGLAQADLTWERNATSTSVANLAPSASLSANVTSGNGPLMVRFTVDGSDADGSIASWTLQYGDGSSQSGSTVPTTRDKTYDVAGGYSANLTVTDDGGLQRTQSVAITVTSAPSGPRALSATAGDRQASLSWSAPATDGGSAITGYGIYRGTASGSLTLIDTIGTNTTYVAAGLTNGVTYHFAVSASNANGEGERSSEANATPIGSPSAPQNLASTAGNTQVSLTWSAPASDGGAAVTGYTVYYGTSDPPTTNFTFTTSTSATVTGLTNGQIYHFAVSASNSAGEGTKSTAVSATPASGSTSQEVDCGSMTVTQGTIDSCSSLQFADLVYATFIEGTGSTKLFEAQFTVNVTGHTGARTLELNGYRGNAAEDLHIQAWNATSSSWTTVTTLTAATTAATTFSGSVYSDHHWPTGSLTIRLIDSNTLLGGADNGRSSWYIDYARLVVG